MWRGAVLRAIRGKRGQAFLREMRDALDAMPVKRLVAHDLVTPDGECCAMGAVALKRGQDVSDIDETEPDEVAGAFNIAHALAAEIAYKNDECGPVAWNPRTYGSVDCETPEERWKRMRDWVEKQIAQQPPSGGTPGKAGGREP